MIYAGDFRKGITFEINGEPHVVLDFQHAVSYTHLDVYKRQKHVCVQWKDQFSILKNGDCSFMRIQ